MGHSELDWVDEGRGVRGSEEQAAAKVAQLHKLHKLLHTIQIMFHDELGGLTAQRAIMDRGCSLAEKVEGFFIFTLSLR